MKSLKARKDQPLYDPEQLRILQEEGVEAWNAWRRENPTVRVRLAGAELEAADLSGALLYGADLFEAQLNRCDLLHARLNGAKLTLAKLKGAKLVGAELRGASLAFADLEGADLQWAWLNGADLEGAWLEFADLRNVRGLMLDDCYVRNAQFDARAKDRWSQLRRAYTGPRMFFTLLFLVAFVLPYLVKTAGWVATNRVQEEVSTSLADFEALADTSGLQEQTRALLHSLVGRARERIPWEAPQDWRESRVWRLVLGFEREWTFWLTALALIIFNVGRGLMTFIVAPMRDAEERSGRSPGLWIPQSDTDHFLHPNSLGQVYGWLWWPHVAVRVLWWVAVVSFLYHAYHWLNLPVWIPA